MHVKKILALIPITSKEPLKNILEVKIFKASIFKYKFNKKHEEPEYIDKSEYSGLHENSDIFFDCM